MTFELTKDISNTKNNEMSDLAQQFKSGLNLSFRRLLVMRRRSNGSFCFCDAQGHVYTVQARDMKDVTE